MAAFVCLFLTPAISGRAGVATGRRTWKVDTVSEYTGKYVPAPPCLTWREKPHRERVRAISIARLWPSRTLHLRPIYVVVCDDPSVEILSRGGLRA